MNINTDRKKYQSENSRSRSGEEGESGGGGVGGREGANICKTDYGANVGLGVCVEKRSRVSLLQRCHSLRREPGRQDGPRQFSTQIGQFLDFVAPWQLARLVTWATDWKLCHFFEIKFENVAEGFETSSSALK